MLKANHRYLQGQAHTEKSHSRYGKKTVEILRDIIRAYPAGQVVIHDPINRAVGWRIYFSQGCINFAESTEGSQQCLAYLLQSCLPAYQGLQPQAGQAHYAFLCSLWESGYISLKQLQSLLTIVTQEALIHGLAISQAIYYVEQPVSLDPILMSTSLWNLVLPIEGNIQQWALLKSEIPSPLSKLYMINGDKFFESAGYISDTLSNIQEMAEQLTRGQSLYQIAQTLDMKVDHLAVLLHPLLKLGAISARSATELRQFHRPQIFCVNNKPATQRYLASIIEPEGFEVLHLSDPIRAIPALMKRSPVLAVIDADLPRLDGYQLCRMVRRRDALRDLPIIMTTENDRLGDRIRTHLSGATAYLPQPFNDQQLLKIIRLLLLNFFCFFLCRTLTSNI
ncbi:MAG: response regulator [Acaryochloridaceae cyanobacterium CSU_5_19]|nr:response regulator [Acaryochloridaceae cyanobacterium CSU_5_19]